MTENMELFSPRRKTTEWTVTWKNPDGTTASKTVEASSHRDPLSYYLRSGRNLNGYKLISIRPATEVNQ